MKLFIETKRNMILFIKYRFRILSSIVCNLLIVLMIEFIQAHGMLLITIGKLMLRIERKFENHVFNAV